MAKLCLSKFELVSLVFKSCVPTLVSENFQITSLIPFTQYQFDFFRTDDGAGAWYSSQFETTNILGIGNPGIPDTYYDFVFKASKNGVAFRDNNSSNTPYTPKPDTLACNTKSIKINYVWFNDTLGVNKYEWIWGNRKSNEQFPEIIFDKAGEYDVKLNIKLPNDSVVNFQQVIVVPDCKKEAKKAIEAFKIKNNSLTVLPNPTNDELNIYLNEVNEYNIVLTDMLGNVVFTSKFQNNTFKLNCKNWANGIYFITISSNSNIYSGKFIKQ